eukprot:GHVR01178736.1.p1 GENE.GHVR01178736.1~~GHVR01178736.1.p1  ORF type:complete len:132 (-),score=12.12 GHVR01178736.1:33-428(-)
MKLRLFLRIEKTLKGRRVFEDAIQLSECTSETFVVKVVSSYYGLHAGKLSGLSLISLLKAPTEAIVDVHPKRGILSFFEGEHDDIVGVKTSVAIHFLFSVRKWSCGSACWIPEWSQERSDENTFQGVVPLR